MRDLKADLEEWNSDLIHGTRSTDWFYLVDNYIERAITAEENYKHLHAVVVSALTEENDLQRQSIQDLSCQVAALKEAIKQIHRYIHPHNCPRYSQFIDDVCDNVLYSPDPGAKVKAVVEAAWKLVDCETRTYSRNKYVHKLKRALADLEGGAPCE